MAPSITVIFVIAFVLLCIHRHIAAYRRLAHIPGPRFADWTRLPLVLDNLTGRNHEILYVSLKYGPLIRLDSNLLVTSDVDMYERMYAPNSQCRRTPYYGVFHLKPRSDNLFFTIDEVRHASVRHKMAPGYVGREAPYIERHIDTHV